MNRLRRFIGEDLDTVPLDGRNEFLKGFAIGREGLFPRRREAFLIDDFKDPIEIRARRPIDPQFNDHVIVTELAGKLREFVGLFFVSHGDSVTWLVDDVSTVRPAGV